jgi:hypothetical protein
LESSKATLERHGNAGASHGHALNEGVEQDARHYDFDMRLQMTMNSSAVTMGFAQLDADQIQLSVAHAALGDDLLGEPAHLLLRDPKLERSIKHQYRLERRSPTSDRGAPPL